MNLEYLFTKRGGLYPKYKSIIKSKHYNIINNKYNNDILFIEKLYLYINGLKEPKKCYCGKNTRFVNFVKGYKKYCSSKCAQNDPVLRAKIKQTNLERYGVEHAAQSEKIKEKAKLTCIKRYGGKGPMSNLNIQIKSQTTCMKNNGTKTPIQNDEIKKRIELTNLKKYGNTSTLHGINENRIKQIKKDKYGNYNNYNKIKQTMLNKYGVEHNSQVSFIHKKQLSSFGQSMRLKTINENLHYQSQPELNFIHWCQSNNINIWDGPSIPYILNNKNHIYHIDFETNNEIVEIKSSHHWYKKDLESGKIKAKNEAAREYAGKIGKEFKFLLDIDYSKLELPL